MCATRADALADGRSTPNRRLIDGCGDGYPTVGPTGIRWLGERLVLESLNHTGLFRPLLASPGKCLANAWPALASLWQALASVGHNLATFVTACLALGSAFFLLFWPVFRVEFHLC